VAGVTGFSSQLAATADDSPQAVEAWWEGAWHPGLLLGCRIQADGSALARIRLDSHGTGAVIWTPFDRVRPAAGQPVQGAGRQGADAHPNDSTTPRRAPGSGGGGRHRLRPATGEPTSMHSGAMDDRATVRLPLTRVAVPAPGGPDAERGERSRPAGSARRAAVRTDRDRLPG
jgi:hypothetical protein